MKNKKMVAGIALFAAITVFACTQQKKDDESDFRVAPVNGGKSIKIVRYMGKKQAIRIPARLYKFPVTGIENEAFKDKDLISVTIPNGVTFIGDNAFQNNQLTSITIPNSVTSVGKEAFLKNQLTSVTIGNKVTAIGDAAFGENQLTGITIPNSVISIGDRAFRKNKLTSVTIGKGVTTIGDTAFGENQLTSVTLPVNVTGIGYAPFIENTALTAINVSSENKSYSSVNGVLYDKDVTTLIQWPAGITDSVIIPDSVTRIKQAAFWKNPLTGVTIGNGVVFIEQSAFSGNQLTSVTIPDSVTFIGDYAFSNNQLTSITIGAKVDLEDNWSSDAFDRNFIYLYLRNDRKAGTYTRPNANSSNWSRK